MQYVHVCVYTYIKQ